MHYPTEIITLIVLRLYKPILLATGLDHTILIGEKTYVWGRNNYGQLGLGDKQNRKSPQELPLCNIKSISCGMNHTIALSEYDVLYVWGANYKGQLGLGDFINKNSPQKLILPLRIKSIVCGGYHTVVLTFSSTIYVWGYNSDGQLGLGGTINKNTPQELILDTVESVSCGLFHTIALTCQSEIYVWGFGREGQLGLGDYDTRYSPQKLNLPLLNIKSISCGGDYTIALVTDGTLYAWGDNRYGQLGLGYRDTQNEPSVVVFPVLEADSGYEKLSRIKSINCGSNHSVAITISNLLYVWGWNVCSQLGLGDRIDRLRPQKLIFKNVKTIVCDVYHTIAITNTDDVYIWGENDYGRLGLGDECNRNVPCQLKFKF